MERKCTEVAKAEDAAQIKSLFIIERSCSAAIEKMWDYESQHSCRRGTGMASSLLSCHRDKYPCHLSITGIPECLLLNRTPQRNRTLYLDQIATRSLHKNYHQKQQQKRKLTAFGYWSTGSLR
jgi:hypothetical protein